MNRRKFLTGTVATATVVSGAVCLGYTRTRAEDYQLLDAGYVDETA